MTWLEFYEVHDTGRTKIWNVHNAENDSFLGVVKWHGPWRQYVYGTQPDIIWNPACMRELITFIENEMRKRKK